MIQEISVGSDFHRKDVSTLIRLEGVHKDYDNGTKALKGVSLRVNDGEFAFLIGPSGSGKSTLIKLITGEIKSSQGQIMVNGFDMNNLRAHQVPHMRRTLGIIFQDFRLIDKKTVYQNLDFAMRAVGSSHSAVRRRISFVLELVGLIEKKDHYPGQLSGGEQQRVAIARAIVNNPSMIIADEPTGNLDPSRSMEIMTLLQQINDLGTTLMVVTHEKNLVNRFAKRVIAIENGRVISDGNGGYEKEDDSSGRFEAMNTDTIHRYQGNTTGRIPRPNPSFSPVQDTTGSIPRPPQYNNIQQTGAIPRPPHYGATQQAAPIPRPLQQNQQTGAIPRPPVNTTEQFTGKIPRNPQDPFNQSNATDRFKAILDDGTGGYDNE